MATSLGRDEPAAYSIGSEVIATQVLGLAEPFCPPEAADVFLSYGYTVLALPRFRRLEMVVNSKTGEVHTCVVVPVADGASRVKKDGDGLGEPGHSAAIDYPEMTDEDWREVAKAMGK